MMLFKIKTNNTANMKLGTKLVTKILTSTLHQTTKIKIFTLIFYQK